VTEPEVQEVITGLIEPESVAPTPAALSDEKPKRTRRKRSSSAEAAGLDAYDEFKAEEPAAKPTRTRGRAAKLTGGDVSAAVQLGTGIYAQLTGQGYWLIPEAESKAWAGELAALLNRIPSKYVRAATDLSGYAIVATGIYSSVKPRLDMSADIRREQAAIRRAEAMATQPADPAAVTVPWDAS